MTTRMRASSLFVAGLLAASGSAAIAQQEPYPDLKGTWVGPGQSVTKGQTDHWPEAGEAEPAFRCQQSLQAGGLQPAAVLRDPAASRAEKPCQISPMAPVSQAHGRPISSTYRGRMPRLGSRRGCSRPRECPPERLGAPWRGASAPGAMYTGRGARRGVASGAGGPCVRFSAIG
jgi:hypothetical protein